MAKEQGYELLALTDINCTSGVYDFLRSCDTVGIHPVIGIDFRQQGIQQFIALAKNREGFREMNELLSYCNRTKEPIPAIAPDWNHVIVSYPFHTEQHNLREFEYKHIRSDQLNAIRGRVGEIRQSKLLIAAPVTFQDKKHYNLHRILRSVDNNVLISKLPANQLASDRDSLVERETLLNQYRDFPQIIANTKRVLESCEFKFDFTTKKNKANYTYSKWNDKELLTKLAFNGMARRYGKNHNEAKQRIIKELEIIDKLNFGGYFLTTWDIVNFSQSQGYFHVGRGSGANSIVSYCLGITNICPLELNLYFERFLNPSRTSPPDFDIDWSWQDRDEILDYIFRRFDMQRTAFVGTISEFKHRSMMREIGKVFGLPKEELDELSKNRTSSLRDQKIGQTITKYAQLLDRFPNQRSMHPCGVIISEEPLTYYTALDMPPKGYQTIQMDMYVTEDIGFDKLDILSQRGLGNISDTLTFVKENQGIDPNITEVKDFKDDPQLNHKLAQGQTLGCFYIESPAMRGLLRRLKCDNYYTLVAASSIIRPGVAKSGMMREYVDRHNNPTGFKYFHQVFEEQLSDTYGVMVYQEDVMKIAHHFAGLDLSEADILRRAMSGKTRSKKEFDKVKEKYFANCHELGYSQKLTNEVYRQIESFAGYSFCKAHSASYSVESYQSLFLKTYYPVEFMTAVINNEGGFYRTEVYVHEAKMAGATIHLPCVNRSEQIATVISSDIFLGLNTIDGLDNDLKARIITERKGRGVFSSIQDFVERVPIGVESMQTLIFVGAFRWTSKTKGELILEARTLLANYKHQEDRNLLFKMPIKEFKLPHLPSSIIEDAYDELELIGFPISCTPFDLLKTNHRGDTIVSELLSKKGMRVRMVAYLISRKHVPTVRGSMEFGTWIDVNGEYFDTTHFPEALKEYPFSGGGCYLIQGVVDVDFHFPSVVVEKIARLPMMEDPRYSSQKERPQFKSDYSGTNRKPYPQAHEIGLPR